MLDVEVEEKHFAEHLSRSDVCLTCSGDGGYWQRQNKFEQHGKKAVVSYMLDHDFLISYFKTYFSTCLQELETAKFIPPPHFQQNQDNV